MTQSLHDARGALRGARKRARRARQRLYLRDYSQSPGKSLAAVAAEAEAVMHERMLRLATVLQRETQKVAARQARRRIERADELLTIAEFAMAQLEQRVLNTSFELRLQAKNPRFSFAAGEKPP